MKKLYLMVIVMLCAVGANAFTGPDLSSINNPNSINVQFNDDYKAKSDHGYEGRNKKVIQSKHNSVSKSNDKGRTVSLASSNVSVQIDNLESTSGEMVDKLETDRIKQSIKQTQNFEKSKQDLIKAYNNAKLINVEKIGQEQDPYIQPAFKCADVKNCKSNNTKDKHAAKKCSNFERLHWTGKKWTCIGSLDKPVTEKCDSKTQYSEFVNGGFACINYIYEWKSYGYTDCNSSETQTSIYKCARKKRTGTATVVADTICPGDKPEDTRSCTYYGSWETGVWGSCAETCVKTDTGNSWSYKCSTPNSATRSVWCEGGTECKGTKPASSKTCGGGGGSSSGCTGYGGTCANNAAGGRI